MYSLTDLCCLCLINGNKIKSISLQDNDGIVVKIKLEYVLSEAVNFKSEVLNNICIDCLNALNYVYKFKRECLQNLTSLNNYIEKMSTQSQEYNCYEHPDEIQDQMTSANHFIASRIQHDCTERDEIIQIKNSTSSENQKLKCTMNTERIITLDNSEHLTRESQIPLNNEEIEIVKQELEYVNDEIEIKQDPLFLDDEDSEENSSDNFPNEPTNNSDCTSAYLTDQMENQNVESLKRYKCDLCYKIFDWPSHLEIHSRKHSGERPFKCTICKKTFSTAGNLSRHEGTHKNERHYKCSVCHKRFTQSSVLTRHMQIHTGEKPFQCEVCQYKFTRAGSLKMHMRIHTGEKPFTCKHCGWAFNQYGSLTKHVQTQHNGK